MNWTLRELYRHPVKSLGEEACAVLRLEPGRPVPWDRAWAIGHAAGEWDEAAPQWLGPRNFVNQTHVPRLAQIAAAFDEASGLLRLSHPDRPDLAIRPGTAASDAALTEWVAPLTEGTTRQGPFRVCRADGIQFTDFDYSHVSIGSIASRRALEEIAGHALEPIRFRMNLWLEGLAPWEELDLVDREIAIGDARLCVVARVTRCNATTANPATGVRDVPVPALLKRHLGHSDFGVYAQVTAGGAVRGGDTARLV
jgi:uncharacterized protein YcbX